MILQNRFIFNSLKLEKSKMVIKKQILRSVLVVNSCIDAPKIAAQPWTVLPVASHLTRNKIQAFSRPCLICFPLFFLFPKPPRLLPTPHPHPGPVHCSPLLASPRKLPQRGPPSPPHPPPLLPPEFCFIFLSRAFCYLILYFLLIHLPSAPSTRM